ncbi:kinase-like protein [Trematosphaeria pertusa]|uniref:Kinase-like protein n=1 Tax=Trematosphaeria pertusa TaxID=390896 RepID=A0A6A6HUM2_9PLEO|nr:kinase-like protein [Trematosphaeria pertusa]KAF2241458.1 kinase-like protein [Trematosphaeria pertusa]
MPICALTPSVYSYYTFLSSCRVRDLLSRDMASAESPHIESRLRKQALRLLTLTVTKLATQRCLRKLFTHSGGAIFYLNFCIKFGDSVTLAEANALRFIAKHTSIPVPRVYHAFTHQGRTYLLMERIRGETIAKRWHSLSDTSKSLVFSQLKRMIEELRSIPSQVSSVSNLEGGPIYDCRLPRTSSWGPFGTLSDFHLALRNDVTLESLKAQSHNLLSPAAISDITRLVVFHESVIRPPVLTHGDLSSFNILLRDDKVVGIIDWETAGWLPYYWEYTTAWHANPQNYFWQKEVGNFLEPQEEELSMERIRRTYFGEI